jgi:hypothetical protein
VLIEHVVPEQHTPVGCGHTFGVHEPDMVHAPTQFASVTIEHEPSGAQHAPVGCGQTFGVHVPALVHAPAHAT